MTDLSSEELAAAKLACRKVSTPFTVIMERLIEEVERRRAEPEKVRIVYRRPGEEP